jgi:hypothetical protein
MAKKTPVKKKSDPPEEREDALKMWKGHTESADKAYGEWEKDFDCDILEDFYLGHQHEEMGNGPDDLYTINLVFPSIEVKIPSFLYAAPQLRVTPRPAKADDLGSQAEETCKLLEDTGQTLMTSRAVGWKDSHYLSLRESFYRFGVTEQGYSNEIGDNPNGGKPLLKPNSNDPYLDDDDDPVIQPEKIPITEQVWSRRIPAHQFRAPAVSKNEVLYNDWLGYFEWMHPEDIKATRGWDNKDQEYQTRANVSKKYQVEMGGSLDERNRRYGLVKVWKVWDLRTKERHVFPADGTDFFVYKEPYKTFPLSFIRPYPVLDSFYPLPPVYNWISPQRELNEIRNTQRTHRRRARRRYMMTKGGVEAPELDKLENGPDMTVIEVARQDALKALEDAPLGSTVQNEVGQTEDDFMRISGVGGEQQGISESTTATQANIIDVNAKIRDSFGRKEIGEWVSDGMFQMLSLLREKAALPLFVMVNVDWSGPQALQEAQKVQAIWQRIEATDLGSFDFDVTVDVDSLSPMNEDQKRQNWNQVLSVFANPTLMQILMSSDVMLKKTMGFYGVKSDRELQEIKQAMAMVLQQLAMAAQAQAQAKGVGGGKQTGAGAAGPGPTPGNTDIAQQLQAGNAGAGLPN